MAKRPVGRPTKYDPAMCDDVVNTMRGGGTKLEVCAELGIVYDTFLEWQRIHPEFFEAVKQGTGLSEAFWTRLGQAGATGSNPNANATFWIFNMKNRFDWSDKRDIHQTGDVTLNVVTGIERAPDE
jgi:transposase